MTTIDSISQAATDLKDKVMGTDPAKSGEEPPAGLQGKGTATDPYDQGNATGEPLSGEEPPAGLQGKGTARDPYDQGNAPEQAAETASSEPTASSSSNGATAPPKAAGTKAADTQKERNPLSAASSRRAEERDVSPGTLADGSHARTSGDRGESYEPGRFNRLKGKLQFGKH